MKNDFAGQRATQSEQRFLDSSASRLIRHAASCETAGGDLTPSPAGKDQKLSQGCGDGVPAVLASEASLPSSLDKKTNNRNTEANFTAQPVGRGKHCGRFSIRGRDACTNKICYRRVNCSSWTCSYCGPRKAKRAKRAIRDLAEKLRLNYFLTLTLNPANVPEGEDATKHLQLTFDKFRTYLRREFGEAPVYIRILEYQKNGSPHYHILTVGSRPMDNFGSPRSSISKKIAAFLPIAP